MLIFKGASIEAWGILAHTQLYRQFMIGNKERHVQETHKSFNWFENKSSTANINVAVSPPHWWVGVNPVSQAPPTTHLGDSSAIENVLCRSFSRRPIVRVWE